MIGLVEIADKFTEVKSSLLNLLRFLCKGIMLRMVMITDGEDEKVNEILKERGKEHFLKRSFELLKNNNKVIAETINKVLKVDEKII